jgi:hypothetical protein
MMGRSRNENDEHPRIVTRAAQALRKEKPCPKPFPGSQPKYPKKEQTAEVRKCSGRQAAKSEFEYWLFSLEIIHQD